MVTDANTARAIVVGGTGATTASAARTNLGVSATDATITAIAALDFSAAGSMFYSTAADTFSLITTTAAGRALLDDADASAQRTTLGLGTAAVKSTGTSGDAVPLLNVANTWSGTQTLSGAGLKWASTSTTAADPGINLTNNSARLDRILNTSTGLYIGVDATGTERTLLLPNSASPMTWRGDDVVTATASQSLTNKTITSPTLSGTMSGGTFTGTFSGALSGTVSGSATLSGNTTMSGVNPLIIGAADTSAHYQKFTNSGGNAFIGLDSSAGGTLLASSVYDFCILTEAAQDVVFGTTNTERVRIAADGGITVGSPTGGSKGAGTINAVAVYDDNVLLTCYVLDAALDGVIDMTKWDSKVPNRMIPATTETVADLDATPDEEGNYPTKTVEIEPEAIEERIHEDARKFEARLGGQYDPLDIDKYAAHWKEKRHLTSMPNEETFDPLVGMPTGSWIQRLIETVEIQAVHIDQLNQRLKALEAK